MSIHRRRTSYVVASATGVVTNGLQIHLDAGNASSYPGTGTLWNDLTGNGNNATLVNGPTFESTFGSIVFDGINDHVTLPSNLYSQANAVNGAPLTISVWVYPTSNGIIFGQQNQAGSIGNANAAVPAIYINENNNLVTSTFWGGSTQNISTSSSSYLNTWINVVVTFESGVQLTYVNGSQIASLSKTQTGYNPSYFYFLGTGTWANWPNAGNDPYIAGNIAAFHYYNRALLATEVTQNYNTLKGRFGL